MPAMLRQWTKARSALPTPRYTKETRDLVHVPEFRLAFYWQFWVALHLDVVFEMRVLFRMMGKVKTTTKMVLALLSAKCKTLSVKRDDVGKRSGNQHLCLRRSS